MKSNIVIFGIIGVYFLVVGTLYTGWNLYVHGRIEWTGTVALYGCMGLCFLIAYYMHLTHKKAGGIQVEDLPDADIDDGDPETGEFSPWSWWPILLAGAGTLFPLGLALGFGFWITFLSVPMIIVATVGWVYEYYRGYFAR